MASNTSSDTQHELGMAEFDEVIEELRDLADRLERNGHVAGLSAHKRLDSIEQKVDRCFDEEMVFAQEGEE